MNQEVAEKWVAALRSGEYEQTNEKLRAVIDTNPGGLKLSGSFCCLGVLCNLFAAEHTDAKWEMDVKRSVAHFNPGNDDGDDENLPDLVREWAGMYSALGAVRYDFDRDRGVAELRALRLNVDRLGGESVSTLADANDHGVSFEKLATFIERNWRHL